MSKLLNRCGPESMLNKASFEELLLEFGAGLPICTAKTAANVKVSHNELLVCTLNSSSGHPQLVKRPNAQEKKCAQDTSLPP